MKKTPMAVGRIEFAPDYKSKSVARRIAHVRERCDWCGRDTKQKDLRIKEVRGQLFNVCPECPPPDNPNAMRV